MNWYLEAWKNYVTFTGRARRKAYWMFVLFNIIALIVAGILDSILGFRGANSSFSPFSNLYSLAVFLPGLAVAIRRLHDTGRCGWWILLGFIPIIGWIVLLVFMVQDSQPGENQYGPNPKGA